MPRKRPIYRKEASSLYDDMTTHDLGGLDLWINARKKLRGAYGTQNLFYKARHWLIAAVLCLIVIYCAQAARANANRGIEPRLWAMPLLMFVAVAGVGAGMVRYARGPRDLAWRTGLRIMAVGVAATGWISGGVGWMMLVPLAAIGWVELAFFPALRPNTRPGRGLMLFFVALALAGAVWPTPTGMRALAALAFMMQGGVLSARYMLARGQQERTLMFLTFFMMVAGVGAAALAMMQSRDIPGALDVAVLLVPLLPSAYGYVVLRQRFKLDFAAARALAAVLMGLSGGVAYGLFYDWVQRWPVLVAMEPMLSGVFMALAMLLAVPAYGPLRALALELVALPESVPDGDLV